MHFNQSMLREFKSINLFLEDYEEILLGSSIVADIDENHSLFKKPFNYTLAGTSLEELNYQISMSNLDKDSNIFLFIQHYMVNDQYRDKEFKKKLISQNNKFHIIELFLKNTVGIKVYNDYKNLKKYSLNEENFVKKNGFNHSNLNDFKKNPLEQLIVDNEKKFVSSTMDIEFTYKQNLKLIKRMNSNYKNLRIIFIPYNGRLQNYLKEYGIFNVYKDFRDETLKLSPYVFDFTDHDLFNSSDLDEISKTHHDGIHLYPKYLSLILDNIENCIVNKICSYNNSSIQ